MDPATMALVGQGAGLATGLVGYLLSLEDQEKAQSLIQKSLNEYGEIDLPTLEKLTAQELGPSALTQIQEDPRLRQSQMAALDRLQSIADEGGYTLEDKAVLNKNLNAAALRESAGRARIAEDMAARGVGGSGAELAMQLQNQQAGADRAHQAGLDQAAAAQKRMFDAILAGGRMAGDVRGQEWGQKSAAAQAQDAIARYNATARTGATQYNNAQAQNQFGSQMDLTRAKAGARGALADAHQQKAAGKRAIFGGAGQSIGQGVSSWADAQEEDE